MIMSEIQAATVPVSPWPTFIEDEAAATSTPDRSIKLFSLAPNSTKNAGIWDSLAFGRAEAIFVDAGEELFEDGIESGFSRSLEAFIWRYGAHGAQAITTLVLSGKFRPHLVAEALIWIGRSGNSASYNQRLWLLELCLRNRSAIVRDAAILGLASMEDVTAIPYVRAALDRESNVAVRRNLLLLLGQLESQGRCHFS